MARAERKGTKGKDAGWTPLCLNLRLLLRPAHVLKDTSSLRVCDLPAHPPTSCTNTQTGCFPALLCYTRRLGCRVGRHGLGEGVGYTLTPAPPFKRSSKPSWISNEKPLQGDSLPLAVQRCAAPGAPCPVSLLDGLPVAVSLAFLSILAAAAAGFAAVAPVPGAAGLAHLADLAAVLQGGAGVSPLQPVVLQELGLERSQVLLAAPDFSSQQHDVSPVPCFL